jgi:hypothetical protein
MKQGLLLQQNNTDCKCQKTKVPGKILETRRMQYVGNLGYYTDGLEMRLRWDRLRMLVGKCPSRKPRKRSKAILKMALRAIGCEDQRWVHQDQHCVD